MMTCKVSAIKAVGIVLMVVAMPVASCAAFLEGSDIRIEFDDSRHGFNCLGIQNKIDGKDFAALDPEQERLKTELSFSGVQYLYKTGAIVEDPTRQISLDEAIIAQACSMDELSIVATVKRNIGALTDNINKPPYKLLFNGSTNSFSLVNNVRVSRVVDNFLAQKESVSTGRKRLVLVHGNRFLLHLVLSEVKQSPCYNTEYLDITTLPELIIPLCQKYWDACFDAMEIKYPDAYPAHIYKNVGRIREIKVAILAEL